MREKLTKDLLLLAERCSEPLYLVGGSVRDYLAGTPLPRSRLGPRLPHDGRGISLRRKTERV